MRLPLKEIHARTLGRALSGGVKGGVAGAAASLATGAAIVATAPAWLPLVGGSALVVLSTVAAWSMTGTAIGAVVAGARAYWQHTREEKAFHEAFPPAAAERSAHES